MQMCTINTLQFTSFASDVYTLATAGITLTAGTLTANAGTFGILKVDDGVATSVVYDTSVFTGRRLVGTAISNTVTPGYESRRAREGPTDLLTGNSFGVLRGRVWNIGTGDWSGTVASVDFLADGNHGSGSLPTKIQFNTTPSGSASSINRWEIDSSGHFKPIADNTYDIGGTGQEIRNLYVDGTANIDNLAGTTLTGNILMSLNEILFGIPATFPIRMYAAAGSAYGVIETANTIRLGNDVTNYTEISSTGTITQVGSAIANLNATSLSGNLDLNDNNIDNVDTLTVETIIGGTDLVVNASVVNIISDAFPQLNFQSEAFLEGIIKWTQGGFDIWEMGIDGLGHFVLRRGAIGSIFIDNDTDKIHLGWNPTVASIKDVIIDPIIADGTQTVSISTEADGNNGVGSLHIDYATGDLQSGDCGHVVHINIDESEASSSDSTTEICGVHLSTTTVEDIEKVGICVDVGFDNALDVHGAAEEDPGYGYEITSTVATDRVNSGGAGDDAFINDAVNQQIFDNVNDSILLGSDAEFEDAMIILSIEASGSIFSNPIAQDIYYSRTGGNWAVLTILDDGTNGFQQSGNIAFNKPGDWTKDDEDMDGNAITNAFYIAIVRTRIVLATPPTELYFKTFSSLETGMKITGRGYIQPTSSTDAAAPNNSVYYSTDQSNLVYKDSGGGVNDLY